MIHHGLNRIRRMAPRAAGFLMTHFGCLWCACYVALVLLAVAEVVVLRQLGVDSIPQYSLRHVSVGEFCVSDDGRWAAARMGFRCASARKRIIHDVVMYDFLGGTTRRLCLDQFQPCCVAISPTTEDIAIACLDRSIYVWSGLRSSVTCSGLPAKDLRLLYRDRDEGITRLIFAPDGRRLAVVGDRYVSVLRYPEGELVHRLVWAAPTSLAFAEDSRRLILVSRDGALCWWDTSSAQQVATKALAACQVDGAALSAGGRLVAYALSDGSVTVRSLEADTELWQHSMPSFHKYASPAIDFSPSGGLLAHVCWTWEQYQITCYDALTGQCLGQSPRYDATFKGMVVTSDNLVYSWDTTGVIRAWQVGPDGTSWRFSFPLAVSGYAPAMIRSIALPASVSRSSSIPSILLIPSPSAPGPSPLTPRRVGWAWAWER